MSRVRDEYYNLCACVCVCVVEYKVCAEVPVHNIISFYSLFLLSFLLLCVSTRETKRQTLLLSSVLINSLALSLTLSLCFLHTTRFRHKKIDIYDGDVLLVQSPGDDEE